MCYLRKYCTFTKALDFVHKNPLDYKEHYEMRVTVNMDEKSEFEWSSNHLKLN